MLPIPYSWCCSTGISPASAPAVHSILTALVAQPCVPATVAQDVTSAVSQGFADAPASVFASLSGQGVSPQLTCLGNGFGIAWLTAVRSYAQIHLPRWSTADIVVNDRVIAVRGLVSDL